MYFNNCVEGKNSECLFDTAHKTPRAQEVEILKLQLSTYNSFFTGETQEDACECLMLLIEIMDKGFGLCPTIDNISSKGSFSELLFSFVLEKYIIYEICTVKSPAFETTSPLYVTPTELLMQEHKQTFLRPVLVLDGTTFFKNLYMEMKISIRTYLCVSLLPLITRRYLIWLTGFVILS